MPSMARFSPNFQAERQNSELLDWPGFARSPQADQDCEDLIVPVQLFTLLEHFLYRARPLEKNRFTLRIGLMGLRRREKKRTVDLVIE
jgi:hypothetical protein